MLHSKGVDILFAGHVHYYSRMVPYNNVNNTVDTKCLSDANHTYTDPKYMTLIISGAPGDVEGQGSCTGTAWLDPLRPACDEKYGYGMFSVIVSVLDWTHCAPRTMKNIYYIGLISVIVSTP